MKYFKVVAFVVLLCTFWGCKKDKGTTPVYTVEGLWVGNIGSGTQVPGSYFALYLKNDGTLERKNTGGSTIARGDFTLTGKSMTGKYVADADGALVSFTAVMDDTNSMLTANWKDLGTGSGSFIIYKQ